MAQGQLVGILRHLRSLRDRQTLRDAADSQLLEWFAREREDAPFVALVRRHGPMGHTVRDSIKPTANCLGLADGACFTG